MPDEPKKHHYLPVFYLQQWATGEDGKLCEFSKPYRNIVKPKRVHPAGTGYVERLYELIGLEGEAAQTIEREFMKPVDGRAATLLQDFLRDKVHIYSRGQRAAWTQFLVSLIMRNPEEIALCKRYYIRDWNAPNPRREAGYAQRWVPGLPPTLQEFAARFDQQSLERNALEALARMISNPTTGDFISGMLWGALRLPFDCPALLTSDRPIIMSNGLRGDMGHLIMPLSPKRVFYAVNSDAMQRYLAAQPPKALANRINNIVTAQAVKYVYSSWDVQLPFVQRRMGTGQLPPFFDRMQEHGAAADQYLIREHQRVTASARTERTRNNRD